MEEKVLFTCVGSTDPVRGERDGALLHIIRHYLPQRVYIVLSAEMEKKHQKDDRYNKAIQKFCEDFKQEIDVRFLFSEIKDVSDFDIFDTYFEEQLTAIIRENPQAEILLNISSGSPQMTMTLCLLATKAKFKNTKVIQVKSPEKGANISDTTIKENYDTDMSIVRNKDNDSSAENRCSEPRIFAIKRAFELKQVQTLLENYEYESAKILLSSFGLPESSSLAMTLTEHLLDRQNLKLSEAKKRVAGMNISINLMPVSNPKCIEETEFFLVLQNLCTTGKITEFTLRLNPFIIRIQELYLLKKLDFDCSKIKITNSKNIEEISRKKIQEQDAKLMTFLDRKCKDGFKDSIPSIFVYNGVISYCSQHNKNAETRSYIKLFKICERVNCERNSSAHSLYGINEQDLKIIGTSSKQILETCKELLTICYGKECSPEIFDLYDRVNVFIMQNL